MKPKYFTLNELLHSETANRLGIINIPTFEQVDNLRRFVIEILDPIREIHGAPIWVNSGYRCRSLNDAVGGVYNSHHMCMNGYAAADITAGTKRSNLSLFDLVSHSGLPYCELICENGGEWLHVSWNQKKLRERTISR